MAQDVVASVSGPARCAALGSPDIETSRVYENVGPDQLYEQTPQALRANELEVTETDRGRGVITAVGRFEEDRDCADCPQPQRIFEDQEGREQLVPARQDYRRVEPTASVQGGKAPP